MSQRVSDLRSSDRATAATRPGFSGPDLEPAAVRLRFACHSGAVAERGCGSRYSEASTMVQHGRFPERDPISARSGNARPSTRSILGEKQTSRQITGNDVRYLNRTCAKRCELRARRLLSVRPYGTAQSNRIQRELWQAGESRDSRQLRPLTPVPYW
jgi:hypothetical protein